MLHPLDVLRGLPSPEARRTLIHIDAWRRARPAVLTRGQHALSALLLFCCSPTASRRPSSINEVSVQPSAAALRRAGEQLLGQLGQWCARSYVSTYHFICRNMSNRSRVVKGIDPNTGFNVGDARCYVDATPNLSATTRRKCSSTMR